MVDTVPPTNELTILFLLWLLSHHRSNKKSQCTRLPTRQDC